MMPETLFPGFLSSSPQFRMMRLQVFNWGTFSGLHDIPIAPKGFLFLGRSGAGKSTLLDAFSALLVPGKWLNFNAAAGDVARSSKERNQVSYVRGAWSEQTSDDVGDFAVQYLRQDSTWSAIALTYENEVGQTIVLAQIFWLIGKTLAQVDVKRLFLILERPFDLQELNGFSYDVRKLKAMLPDAFVRDEFAPYGERFRRLLGIDSELALRLLHKTQSAKNLDDLTRFLREFMLDTPDTFVTAKRLVTEFTELKEAHQAVVTARDQVQVLQRARQNHDRLMSVRAQLAETEALLGGIDAYRRRLAIDLIAESLMQWQMKLEGATTERQRAEDVCNQQKTIVTDLERQHSERGGAQIEGWEREMELLHSGRSRIERVRADVQKACAETGWAFPTSLQATVDLVAHARQTVEGWQADRDAMEAERDALRDRQREKEQAFAEVQAAINAMLQRPSNLDPHLLTLRRRLAGDLGLTEDDLPFAGELLDVLPEQKAWQGAIERVVGGLGRSMLVSEIHYEAVSNWINAVNLRGRLNFYRVGDVQVADGGPVPDSVRAKMAIKPGPFADWLDDELRRRFDYRCVDTLEEFRGSKRAVTREGLVRHGSSRHEKDDRSTIDDSRYWVLGFDNRDKLALFKTQAHELASAIETIKQEIAQAKARRDEQESLVHKGQILVNLRWSDMDLASLDERIAHLQRLIAEARSGNRDLRELEERLDLARASYETADQVRTQALVNEQKARDKIGDLAASRDKLQAESAADMLSDVQQHGLAIRFTSVGSDLTLETLPQVARQVERDLATLRSDLSREDGELLQIVEGAFAEFKRQWKMDAGDMTTSLDSAPDYFARLERLEEDGLPAFEQRFFDLLRTQSHENLTALATHLRLGRQAIHERMAEVNSSLALTPFNPGTYLQIQVMDLNAEDVRIFRQEINEALSHAFSDDREEAERRFIVLSRLVERLASQTPEDKRWQQTVLDVRRHVDFVGKELDQNHQEVEIYRSGAAKSGGQRQKLATTCLAAALRYQLGGGDEGMPTYAPVILDEAFDKADSEFTTLAMQIFVAFGFQMIIATPLKSVMTLEPFIGGACLVDIRERKHSGVLLIEYDTERQRLNLAGDVHDTEAAFS